MKQHVDTRKEEQMMKTLQQMKVEESDSETEERDKQKQSKWNVIQQEKNRKQQKQYGHLNY